MKRLLLVMAVVLGFNYWTTSAASAQRLPVAEAQETAEILQEATEQQGVCYGWALTVNNAGTVTMDTGSNRGPGKAPDLGPECKRAVRFDATVTWTSEASDLEDSSSWTVNVIGFTQNVRFISSSSVGLDNSLLRVNSSNLTANPEDEVQLVVMRLPGMVAAKGLAPQVQLTPNTQPLAAGDAPTNTPGSDWLRSNMGTITLLVLGALSAAVYAIYQLVHSRSQPSPVRSVDDYPGDEPNPYDNADPDDVDSGSHSRDADRQTYERRQDP